MDFTRTLIAGIGRILVPPGMLRIRIDVIAVDSTGGARGIDQ